MYEDKNPEVESFFAKNWNGNTNDVEKLEKSFNF